MVERRQRAGHLQTHVKAFSHAQLFHHVGQALSGHLSRTGDAILRASDKAVFVHVGDHNVARTNVFRHRRRHNANGPAGDQHIFANQIKRAGMHGVAERVKMEGQIVRDIVRGFLNALNAGSPDIRRSSPDGLRPRRSCCSTGGYDRHGSCGSAAGDMAFARNAIANLEAFHFLTNTYHFTNIFVTDNHRYRDGFATTHPSCRCERQSRRWLFYSFNQQIVMTEFRPQGTSVIQIPLPLSVWITLSSHILRR